MRPRVADFGSAVIRRPAASCSRFAARQETPVGRAAKPARRVPARAVASRGQAPPDHPQLKLRRVGDVHGDHGLAGRRLLEALELAAQQRSRDVRVPAGGHWVRSGPPSLSRDEANVGQAENALAIGALEGRTDQHPGTACFAPVPQLIADARELMAPDRRRRTEFLGASSRRSRAGAKRRLRRSANRDVPPAGADPSISPRPDTPIIRRPAPALRTRSGAGRSDALIVRPP